MQQEQEQKESRIFHPPDPQDLTIIQISRWVKLIASIGFALGGIVVFTMLFQGAAILQQTAGILPVQISGIYSILVITFFIIFFITALLLFYLHRSATLLIQGIREKNKTLQAEGFNYLKKFFTLTAVISILQLIANISTLWN
ncbi:hypothetical protein [Niabella terrae]